MTNNDTNDIDVDADGDFDKGVAQKASFKETWDSNPLLKIGAIVLGGAILIAGFMTFFGGEEDLTKAQFEGATVETVKIAPGKGVSDEEYRKALEEKNRQELEAAQKMQGSFIPQPIDSAQDTGIQIPTLPPGDKANPLDEWRKRAEMKRIEMEERAVVEEAPPPDIVPLVQPVRPQQTMKQDPELARQLSEQMRAIIAAQAPVKADTSVVTEIPSLYTKMVDEQRELEKKLSEAEAKNGSGSSGGSNNNKEKTIVPAGSIVYAQLINELNSDVDGPALAQVLSGPLRGGRALGTFEKQDEYLTLTFNRIVKDGVVYKVDGIALDEDTTLPAHQTDVDHHYWSRIILPAAAAFIKGYASAVAETGTSTTTTAGGGVATEEPEPSAQEEVMKGVESAADTISGVFEENVKKEPTVIVAKGTTMGILFMDSVTTESISN